MVILTAMYGQPQDPAAFDRYYIENHTPIAVKIPGLRGYTKFKPANINPAESAPYYLIALLYFDNLEAIQAGMQTPEGQAAAGDLPNFASGGVTLLVGEEEFVVPFQNQAR
ncbi:MAG: putative ethyl tert-butyl ether degradation protein EthD [Chloroflexi bacterium]|nr:putative ethyl tert-butyl ether degradation protein EthD [Chloroflexota bacterium]